MLATRSFDSGRNTWSSSKIDALYQNSASPRMSNFDGLPAQPDWREQYPAFGLSGESGSLQPSFQQSTTTNASGDSQYQNHKEGMQNLEHEHSHTPVTQETQSSSTIERSDAAPENRGRSSIHSREDFLVSPNSTRLSLGSIPRSSTSSGPTQQPAVLINNGSPEVEGDVKDEDEDLDDDEEMIDAEAEEGAPTQTAAERRAERRKMKRFRLTHQQTRFLMSEFAKQAHPDAAHRDRLSREIPGLSPRQVQVWFQNRRAKIKRLTADDRDRMMKMRAVPDDFDNVQALHSPYGAVHNVGPPIPSPMDFTPGYTDHMSPPPGLNPAFGHVGFSGGIGNPEALSPMSINASDRYYSSPMSNGPRSSNPFDRQGSYQPHSRQQVRPLQPLQLRETMSRSRTDALNSPLRTSMSWKGESLDYNNYPTGHPSPALSGLQQPAYQSEQMGNSGVHAQQQYDANSYPNTDINSSPPQMTFPPSQGAGGSSSSSLQPPSALSRFRASSSGSFPAGLDLRNQFRSMGQNQPPHGVAPRSSSFAQSFQTSGYLSAPLTAPVEFSIPQLSAPINPPQDFSNAYNPSNLGPNHTPRYTPEQKSPQSQHEEQHQPQPQQQGREVSAYLSPVEYEADQRRKKSFEVPTVFESP